MTAKYANMPDNTEEGYKCTCCGYMWNSREALDICPNCGSPCNPYSCKVIDSSNEDY